MILNAIDKQRRVIYYVAEAKMWTETNGKSIMSMGEGEGCGMEVAGVTLKGNLGKAGCQSSPGSKCPVSDGPQVKVSRNEEE